MGYKTADIRDVSFETEHPAPVIELQPCHMVTEGINLVIY